MQTEKKLRKEKAEEDKATIESMQEMLREADEKLLASSKAIAEYKAIKERLLYEKNALSADHQKVLKQLKALFAAYNDQKLSLEKTKARFTEIGAENNSLRSKLAEIEQEKASLKADLSREIEQRRDAVEKFNVCIFWLQRFRKLARKNREIWLCLQIGVKIS